MKPVIHGGDLSAIQARFPRAPEPWIDLSTGINPVPYPIMDLPPDVWSCLPSRSREQALLDAAALRYGVRASTGIAMAPGTQALIQLLPRLVPKSRVAVVGPTYEEHEVCWRRRGHAVEVVASLEEAMSADVVVVVNPDNPSGRLVPAAALRKFGGLLVVDEAFVDVLPSGASLVPDLPNNAIVLRSFGKAYGLAGVRLGFAIAEEAMVARIRDELGPWPVSGPALEIGRQALADLAWLQAATRRLEDDRRRLDALLVAAGFVVLGGTPLFCLARHPNAAEFVEQLGRRGIHVRHFAREPHWLRFGLPADDGAFRRIEGALR